VAGIKKPAMTGEVYMKKKFLVGIVYAAILMGTLTGCSQKPQTVYEAVLPTEAVEASVYVEAIPEMADDFMKGVDISTVLAQEASGVKYYNEVGEETELFRILADAGVNYIRVRVWNDPFDADGNGYGGGNVDAKAAAEIGRRAAQYGMKLCVDFHYSDFWADPAKQMVPKAWAGMAIEEKQTALYNYTKESLKVILDAGADVGMVQIGNEINNGMSGETKWRDIGPLLRNASAAVRDTAEEYERDILIAVHFTNIEEQDKIFTYANRLQEREVDYDVFGVSYYPFWHGTMGNLTDTLKKLAENYGKKVAVLETSYAYTLEDGDGSGNSVSEKDLSKDYAANVQSQATCIRDIMAAIVAAGEDAIGVFYWEPAWIPVGPATDYEANQKLWEQYGSGWASSYAAEYDPEDAGVYYGGSAWDNQALFDFEGHPLPSLNVFKYAKYGTICDLKVDFVKETSVDINIGEELWLPGTVDVVYNDRSQSGPASVGWYQSDCDTVDVNRMGKYTVRGQLADGTEVSCVVNVAKLNYVQNPSFEETDVSVWNVTYAGAENPTDIQTKESDAVTGLNSFHFWSESVQEFKVEQTISGLDAGEYTLQAQIQGGDVGEDAEIVLYALVNGVTYESAPVTLAGWINWQEPVVGDIPLDGASDITVGMRVKCAAKGWGTMDDFYLYKQ